MDHDSIEKLQTMKKLKKNQNYILFKSIFYTLAAISCTMFCVFPSWVLSISSFIKLMPFVSLQNLGASVFNPKCLFIVCNVIVVFLIGESKVLGTKSESEVATDVYDEEMKMNSMKLELSLIDESCRFVKEEKEEENECFLGGEELKERAENFIARVKKQRKLETGYLISSCSSYGSMER